MKRRVRILCGVRAACAAVAFLCGIHGAGAETALRLQNGDRVRASLDQAGELDVYRFTAPAGVDVRLKIRAARGGPLISVAVSDDGAVVRPSKRPSRTVRVSMRDVQEGSYLVGVGAADGEQVGDYRISLSWRSTRTFESVVHVDEAEYPGGPFRFDTVSDAFTGVGGEVARIRVSATKGSLAEPLLKRFEPRDPMVGPATVVSLGGGARAEVPLTAALGRYVVVVGNASFRSGDARLRVKLRPQRRRLDLRGLGDSAAEFAITATSVTPRDGGVLRGDTVGSEGSLPGVPALPDELDEAVLAEVSISPGSVPRRTTFVMRSAPDLDPGNPGVEPAAVALSIGPIRPPPEGGFDAEITLPCGVSEPRVFMRREDGAVVELEAEALQVEFVPQPVARFSAPLPATFQAFSQRTRFSRVAVAASNDHVVVGAPGDVVDGVWNAGSVGVYAVEGSAWVEEARIVAELPTDNGAFGVAVALDGGTLVVDGPGATLVYVRDPVDGWVLQDELRTSSGELFRSSILAIDGDTIVAGTPWTDRSVHVFVRDGELWSEQQVIPAPDENNSFLFGFRVDVSGDTLAVGGAEIASGAWVFSRSLDLWEQQAHLRSSTIDRGDLSAVSVHGDTIAVGSTYASSDTLGSLGEVSVFRRSGESWLEFGEIERPLDLPPGKTEIVFGRSLDLRDGRLIVGAPDEETLALRGRAYVFDDDGSAFELTATLSPLEGQLGRSIGRVVALSPDGRTAILGADGATDGDNALEGSLVFDVE